MKKLRIVWKIRKNREKKCLLTKIRHKRQTCTSYTKNLKGEIEVGIII